MLFEARCEHVASTRTNYDATQVLAQVWQSLATSFSFDQRQMGQGVAQSEIIALIQQVAGGHRGGIDRLQSAGERRLRPLPPVLLAAAPARASRARPQAAEMLLLDPASQGNFEVWS